jgi:hypothetical protein
LSPTKSLYDLWTANYGGFLFFVALGLFWIWQACVHGVRTYRRALVTDPIVYAGRKPPTLRRMVLTICWLTFGISLFSSLAFQSYFIGHRPPHPIPSEGRIYPLFEHGYIVYLTSREHVLVSRDWMIVVFACFLVIWSIQNEGDPFASKFSDTPVGALPRSLLKPSPAGWLSGLQVLLILGGYFVGLLTLMAVLIARAFSR